MIVLLSILGGMLLGGLMLYWDSRQGSHNFVTATWDRIVVMVEAMLRAPRLLSARHRKLRRAQVAKAQDEERTEQYRAALESEWDHKIQHHTDWIKAYRELTAIPHDLSCKYTAKRGCTDLSECDNSIDVRTWAGDTVARACGCGGKKPTPAPGLKHYFRPWNAVELPPRPPIPEMVMPANKFKKQTNQQRLMALNEMCTRLGVGDVTTLWWL